jgi:cGMP-dependent protein kinase
LNKISEKRLGFILGFNDIKKHKWFDEFNWKGLEDKTIIPPFVPT